MRVLGIILGILGLLAAIPMSFLAGVIGGGICVLIGLIALILGIVSTKKNGKGVGSIVLGVLVIILSVIMTSASVKVLQSLKDAAQNTEGAELVAECLQDPKLGLFGAIRNMPADEAGLQQLLDEMKALSEEN